MGLRETGVVAIPPRAGLLAEPAGLAQNIGDVGEVAAREFRRAALAQRPADVEAGQIAHC